ncbi:hypothetical protein ACFPVY_03890 [Flavobacterium qiangtangense]|uniref:Phage protein n=1 Tax=Flavobacterium qiangtangense TaxID=1442595 RepID=A0ABW1PLP5_9FLAO
MEDINTIDTFGKYFHMELLKYYCDFIKHYKLEFNQESEYLHFEFEHLGQTYTIQYSDLIQKAMEEAEILKAKHV